MGICLRLCASMVWLLVCWPAQAEAEEDALRVMAASSLTETFGRAAERFAAETGRPTPVVSFAGSSRVARQLMEGAPADMVAVANPRWMNVLVREGVVVPRTQRDLVQNRLVYVEPVNSPLKASAMSDLGLEPWSKIAIAGPTVPAGQYAREVIDKMGLTASILPNLVIATNVRSTLSLVAQSQVDGGFVYRTDAQAEPRVRVALTLDSSLHSPIRYPVALTHDGVEHRDADAFVSFLLGPGGQEIFQQAGFASPSKSEPVRFRDGPGDSDADLAGAAENVEGPMRLSVWVAVVSLMLSIVPAVGLGWLMARREFWGKSLLSTVLMAPLVLPPVVTGYLLLKAFGRGGMFTPLVEAIGIEVAFTRWGAVVAAAVVGFPLLLILVRQAIESVDIRYPAIAQTLGLSPLHAFMRITFPMALPGIIAGCVLAFARALGEFGATAMIAGDQPGETRTLALAVYALAEVPGGEDAAATLVWISMGLCAVALVAYERLVWRQRRRTMELR
jgi:molybdate transport system permease protein